MAARGRAAGCALAWIAWLAAIAGVEPGACAAASASLEEIPRPEHPNPQMQREQWQNLNGAWDFWEGDECDEAAALALDEFPDRIVVPFCRESALSGLGRKGFVKNVVYRRDFDVPDDWSLGPESNAGGERKPSGRLLLHVGACDWRTVVWVNGKRVGFHEGGSAPITCDVTDALKSEPGAKQELRVWAFDDTRSKLQQCGKQCDKDDSYGCLYTRTTGIWQTVWMERVGATYVGALAFQSGQPESIIAEIVTFPDDDYHLPEVQKLTIDHSLLLMVTPEIRGTLRDEKLIIDVHAGDKRVAHRVTSAQDDRRPIVIQIEVPDARPWSIEDPFLYSIAVSIAIPTRSTLPGGVSREAPEEAWWVVDRVQSYFGFRSITIDGPRVLLNGKPVFQRTILDQGFYPDGIWTAPSDEALKRDIELSMAAGFNGARLHQKVFEPRFHYWADRLGYLTWGETPSWGNDDGNPATHRVVIQEWAEIVARDRNHPSIVGWCPFNETGAKSGPLQNAVTAVTRALDPSRPLLDTSGYTHSDPARDVDDAHDYDQDPVSFRARWWPNALAASMPARYGAAPAVRDRPFFVSEFGGIGWKAPGDPGWGYGNDPKTIDEWYARFQGLCDAQLENPTLFGFCYTQLTDVEQERNGLYYYDRRPKFDVARLRAIVAKPAAIESDAAVAPPPIAARGDWRVVIPSALDDPERSWMCVMSDAKLADEAAWRDWTFDAVKSQSGRPGFGRKEGFDVVIGTPWTTQELYLHRPFEWDGSTIGQAMLVLHHDEEVTLCVNGEELFTRKGWNDRYEPFDVTERARALLRRGHNEISVHVSQTGGGQYFDAALLVAPPASPQ